MKMTAPGAPGAEPTWTTGAKDGIGKALNAASEVVFTLHKGIVNEVYYPREDIACIKEMGMAVTDGDSFFSEEQHATRQDISMATGGVPAYRLVNTSLEGRYVIRKEIITDPFRDSLLQKIIFEPAAGERLNLYVMVSPHLGNRGTDNSGWIDEYKGRPVLYAGMDGYAMALACSAGWIKRSAGYAGCSDGRTDLSAHKCMEWEYQRAENGNIVLTAQIDYEAGKPFVLSLGFGRSAAEAAIRAVASLLDGFDLARERYVDEWRKWHRSLPFLSRYGNRPGKYLTTSASVLRMSEAKRFPGGIVASISIPWGSVRHDDNIGGYHLVWPRDLVETGGAFIALRAKEDVLRIINYLMSTQEGNGGWSQNMWLDGEAYWKGVQMDQTALPLLLLDKAHEDKIIDNSRLRRYWPNVRRALSFLVTRGPATQQGRWEQQPGINAYTIATEVAALLAGAYMAEINHEKALAAYCRETADYWNSRIEEWLYITDTPLSKAQGVDGYYIRTNPGFEPAQRIGDQETNVSTYSKDKVSLGGFICADALALVRFGLRAADDPRILSTIAVIDALLKTDTPAGPGWHRFTSDTYGENDRGEPFRHGKTEGRGRLWPLMTGERAHYALAAGDVAGARKLLGTMESFAKNGFFPEQVWDQEDIPEHELYFGRPTGSAMPLSWAQAEYIKLCCSLKAKRVTDMPRHTVRRYLQKEARPKYSVWRFGLPFVYKEGTTLRIEARAAAMVRWTADGWQTAKETPTTDTGLGIHVADIVPLAADGPAVTFTFFWQKAGHWEGRDFTVHG